MKAEKINLQNDEHKLIFMDLWAKNANKLRDDVFKTPEDALIAFNYNTQWFPGTFGFIFYKDQKPYGMCIVQYDAFRNVSIHAAVDPAYSNFFINKNIIKVVLQKIFQKDSGIHSVLITPPLGAFDVEIVARASGFRKAGILKSFIPIDGERKDQLILQFTREMFNNKEYDVSRTDIYKILRRFRRK